MGSGHRLGGLISFLAERCFVLKNRIVNSTRGFFRSNHDRSEEEFGRSGAQY